MREVEGLEQLNSLVAHEMGPTAWLTISSEMVARFADVTHDHQWIHLDAERARQESPYGVPIVHGLLTLSLYPYFGRQLLKINGVSRVINYGANRVRFPNAVAVGARVRARQTVRSVEQTNADAVRMTSAFVIESEGQIKPACVAETVALIYA
ncbi:MAG: MaoC family dehydratase [Acidobacteriota bacterium]|jgi:acyl dehydratase|nr:MAG: MaoC family dehydratase [Acidobacteriota bacterium]|tara:strand:+ start:408 stop:866 length:459 start_codon:yes stop_codon:yes gene_type:complete